MAKRMTIIFDDSIVFDREVTEVNVAQDIHGDMSASAKFVTNDDDGIIRAWDADYKYTGTALDGDVKLVTA